MPINIEIKAVVADLPALRKRVERLSGTPGEGIYQEDTFFVVPHGRLKLRIFSPDHGELIYYERSDERDLKPSHYLISRTSDPASLLDLLAASLGIAGHVRKRRTLYMIGNTRVHLDEVEHLGTYMELEVVLAARGIDGRRRGDRAKAYGRVAHRSLRLGPRSIRRSNKRDRESRDRR